MIVDAKIAKQTVIDKIGIFADFTRMQHHRFGFVMPDFGFRKQVLLLLRREVYKSGNILKDGFHYAALLPKLPLLLLFNNCFYWCIQSVTDQSNTHSAVRS
jgi:hypothetical protein